MGTLSSGLDGLGVAGVGFDALSLAQGRYYGSRGEELCAICMELDAMGLRLNALSSVREQKRDQVFSVMSNLDNLMVVSTLMLSIGFGFVVDGTFPPKKAEGLTDWSILWLVQVDPLVVYSFLAAWSLIFPFWSLVFCVRMRSELQHEIEGHMKEFKMQLFNVLEETRIEPPQDSDDGEDLEKDTGGDDDVPELQIEAPQGLLDRLRSKLRCRGRAPHTKFKRFCNRRIYRPVSKVARNVHQQFKLPSRERYELERGDILKWADRDLHKRLHWYNAYMGWAQFFLWSGIFCSVFTSALLLGLYMQQNFPSTPLMFKVYSCIVTVNGVGGIVVVLKPIVTSFMHKTLGVWSSEDDADGTGSGANFDGFAQEIVPGVGRSESVESVLPRNWSKTSPVGSLSPTRRSSSAAEGFEPVRPMFVKVREALDDDGEPVNWLQVKLPPRAPSGRFEKLYENVRAKFQARRERSAGAPPLGRLKLDYLVLLREDMELVDDGDLDNVREGDELEVIFSESYDSVDDCVRSAAAACLPAASFRRLVS